MNLKRTNSGLSNVSSLSGERDSAADLLTDELSANDIDFFRSHGAAAINEPVQENLEEEPNREPMRPEASI